MNERQSSSESAPDMTPPANGDESQSGDRTTRKSVLIHIHKAGQQLRDAARRLGATGSARAQALVKTQLEFVRSESDRARAFSIEQLRFHRETVGRWTDHSLETLQSLIKP